MPNGGDGGRRARSVRMTRLRAHGEIEGDDRQRRRERRGGGGRRYGRDWNVEPKPSGTATEKFRVSDDVERWEFQLGAPMPDRKGQVGPDPCGLAERQCQWLHSLASYRLFLFFRHLVLDHRLAA